VPEELGVGLPAPVGVEFEEEEGMEIVAVGLEAADEAVDEAADDAADDADDALELEPELPTGATTPPSVLPDVVVEEVPPAAVLYAARVSPEEGGLTTPTMPP